MKISPRIIYLLTASSLLLLSGCSRTKLPLLDHDRLARENFREDYQWYENNIPFFECSDSTLEQVYYYRWKMYKAHIRLVGGNNYIITEFINHVPWDREPFGTINAASMHHIYEGRWLKDRRYIDSYIRYLYQDGGNDRRYSESIADATWANYLVNADEKFISRQLERMVQVYDAWSDHLDTGKNLYYIAAMPDATEYTIASIDASGGKDGFDDGEAFRPTINSYMYGNALAISKIAALAGDEATGSDFAGRAAQLRSNVVKDLWNEELQHFTDRYKVDNQYVHYWDFIRGRELAGMVPWYFDLPPDNEAYNRAWKHVLDTAELLGKYGLRTQEPSYEYYFKQYEFYQGKRGSQWNGPSWPYQTSQVLTGMANFLNDYDQDVVNDEDYVKLLRMYAMQHYLPDGKLDLVENYDPDRGGPIVFYYWSNHYNHSTFNNLIITGLCGIRPSESDTLVINPLVDNSVPYFCLEDVRYHGHSLTVVYDRDGSKYKVGSGLTVFVDGEKAPLQEGRGKYMVYIGKPVVDEVIPLPSDLALNISREGYPTPFASVNRDPDSVYQAFDGRTWYFPEVSNRWTTLGSQSSTDWLSLYFGKMQKVSSVSVSLFADGKTFAVPDSIAVEYQRGYEWKPVKVTSRNPEHLTGNTINTITFDNVTSAKIKVSFIHKHKQVAISELQVF